MSRRQLKPLPDCPPRRWLNGALHSYVLNGGEENAETRVPVTLFLFDLFERRWSALRAGIEAAERFKRGELMTNQNEDKGR